MALAFWYGGRLMTFGEYTQDQFFIIFVAIIFGGQAAGFLFGFTMSTSYLFPFANESLLLIIVKT
jgi:ATP-binding cassette subfamily B (MDR/TAP) protein 1